MRPPEIENCDVDHAAEKEHGKQPGQHDPEAPGYGLATLASFRVLARLHGARSRCGRSRTILWSTADGKDAICATRAGQFAARMCLRLTAGNGPIGDLIRTWVGRERNRIATGHHGVRVHCGGGSLHNCPDRIPTADPEATLRRTLFSLTLLAAAFLFSQGSFAQPYPTKPIKAIVPFAPGSATDQIARVFAADMAKTLGQPIVVENKPGVNGMLGAAEVARAAPDGYTILVGTNSTNAALKSLMKQLPYDQDTAFAPVGFMGSVPLIVAVNNDVPAKNLRELVDAGQGQAGARDLRQRQYLAIGVHRNASQHGRRADDQRAV